MKLGQKVWFVDESINIDILEGILVRFVEDKDPNECERIVSYTNEEGETSLRYPDHVFTTRRSAISGTKKLIRQYVKDVIVEQNERIANLDRLAKEQQ